VSTVANRASPQLLDGATLNGTVYLFLSGADDASEVRFFLDDPDASGPPHKIEGNPPWDFVGTAANGTALGFNAWSLSTGSHTITAVVITPTGNRITHATFEVS
jgi:hypothetical protein